jgi:3-hydroxy-9,10-secoandrosta-1,3,5(10)-triene-9,17-dione monooxygenase
MHTVNQDVLDIIAKNADQGRVNRKIPAEDIEALKDCGFFGMLLPKSLGGSEHTPQEFFQDHLAIAKADMSPAWACGIVTNSPAIFERNLGATLLGVENSDFFI